MSSEDSKMHIAPPVPLSAPSSDVYISKTTASFHLVHMISSILQERGFSNCEAGVLSGIENLLEGHLVDLFSSIHTLAESAGRPRPSPSDIIEHLSLTYLSHLSSDSLNSLKGPSSPLTQGNSETWEQFEYRQTKAKWEFQDEFEGKMKRVVLDSYEEPVRDYKRFVGRTRKRAKDGRVLERLPLTTITPASPPPDPTTLSLSDDESSAPFIPLPSFLHSPSTLYNPTSLPPFPGPSSASSSSQQFPSTPISQKRRRTSTLIKRDAFSASLATTSSTPTTTIRIKPEPSDDPSDLVLSSEPSSSSHNNLGQQQGSVVGQGGMSGSGAGSREIKIKDNKKPWYMDDVGWVPALPPRHRWRKTYERETEAAPPLQSGSSGRLSTKTLEYLTTSSSSHPALLDDRGRSQVVPHELALVNYHTSSSSLSTTAEASHYSGSSTDAPTSSGSDNAASSGETMDTPHAQGAGFSLGDDLFEGYVRRGGVGLYVASGQQGQAGSGGKRKRWVVGPETRRVGRVG